jgi:cyclopropane-fatty-acyl-phospholipid synthase
MSTRGAHLVEGDRGFTTGGGLLGRLVAPAFAAVVDSIDKRLETGGIDATLPGGERRKLGFRAPGPTARVDLRSWMALVRLATSGSVGWYKAWELGEWCSPDPVPIFELFSANAVSLGAVGRAKGPARWINALAHRLRDNAPTQARANIAAHYDLGNDFYSVWLDRTMTYSSALFGESQKSFVLREAPAQSKGAGTDVEHAPFDFAQDEQGGDTLEVAQRRKIHALLDRLNLTEGTRLLEIGCGWGSLAIEAAERGARVVGLTLSTEQKAWAEREIAARGLSDRIEIRLQDYRDVSEQFDAIASVEMVEAVGRRWWGAYLDCIARNLKPDGRAALQFIMMQPEVFERYARSADFIQTYIFPGGMLINELEFAGLAKERGLSWRDRSRDFGNDYSQTLKLWRDNYDAAVEQGTLEGFSEEFHRLWRYYLMYCEGGFRGGAIGVAQVTLARTA